MSFDEADVLDRQIGARIRHVRKMRGLSQTQLGEAIGVTFQQVQKYERGDNRVSSSALVLVSQALGISPGSLLGFEGPEAAEFDWSLFAEEGAYELMQAVSQIRSVQVRRTVLELARELAAASRPAPKLAAVA